MNLLLAVFVVAGFAVTIERLDLPARAREVGRHSTECLAVLRDDSLADVEKEAALQQRARRLFVLLGLLTGGSALALGLPLLVVWLLDRIGMGSFGGTLALLQRIDFLAATTAVGLLAYALVQLGRSS
ncbi:MAG: hypothetical protein ABEK84_06135 [Salinibacter sp.]